MTPQNNLTVLGIIVIVWLYLSVVLASETLTIQLSANIAYLINLKYNNEN